MGVEGLDKIFNPKRVAVIGASNREGSVGFRLFHNLIGVGFRGVVYPVNPFSQSVQGVTAYPNIKKIPWQIDLAIIATPAHIVPQIVEECGEAGVTGIIIVSSGFAEAGPRGKTLEKEILKLKRRFGMRIVGPNCLGVMRPSIRLNATFANRMAKPGRIAFISQSGALCLSVLDWATYANVGFSAIVSLGGMIDVDLADLIDYFGTDPETRSIVLFIEFIRKPRKFMSASRRFAGSKPIIVVKAGKTREGMKAAASHTAAIAGEDALYDALFSRAGIVRVESIQDMTVCAKALRLPPLRGNRLVAISLSGGFSVILGDLCDKLGFECPELPRQLLDRIEAYRRGGVIRMSNPMDFGDVHDVRGLVFALEQCLALDFIDGIVLCHMLEPEMLRMLRGAGGSPEDLLTFFAGLCASTDKPIALSFFGRREQIEGLKRMPVFPVFNDPMESVRAMRMLLDRGRAGR